MDVVYIDFSKTFGIVSHSIFTVKLVRQELSKWTVRWMDFCLDCRAQSVLIKGVNSSL